MNRFFIYKKGAAVLALWLCCALLGGCAGGAGSSSAAAAAEPQRSTTFAMDTVVTQQAYGPGGTEAMAAVNVALSEMEKRLSLFAAESDIARVNAAAGKGGAEVSDETAALLRSALALSAENEGFAVTIAPITLAWGVTGDHPRVVPDAELETLLPLVNDAAVQLEGNRVTLEKEGMALDLGGIAKGAACAVAADIYKEHEVQSALLNIGGNVFAYGNKPGGEPFRVGFRDPEGEESDYIASFVMTDKVVAVSGGYNRNFEVDGVEYIHIFDPATGKPAESDLVSVGVVHPDGAEADFYSTALFVQGKEGALRYMRGGGEALLLDGEGKLYVSESLKEGFELNEERYSVEFVPNGADG